MIENGHKHNAKFGKYYIRGRECKPPASVHEQDLAEATLMIQCASQANNDLKKWIQGGALSSRDIMWVSLYGEGAR